MIRVLVLLLLSLPAWGDVFVRPTADCPLNGNGTAYACATSGGGAGAWRGFASVSQSTVTAADTVRTCGNFTTADADTATVMLVTNWTNADVIVDGDCSASGGLSRATLDGGGTLDRGLDSGSGGYANAVIRNINFQGFDAHAIIGQNAASTNWLIQNIECDGSANSLTCIRNLTAGATGWIIEDSRFVNCATDCIFTANPLTLRRVTGDEWSLANAEGDFLQSSNTSCNGFIFEDVHIASTKDIKQGIIANNCSDAANVTVRRSSVIKRGLSTVPADGFVGLFFESASGTVTVERSEVRNSRINLFVGGGASLVARSSVFGPSATSNVHCGTSTVSCVVENNSISGAGTSAIEMAGAGAGGLARNNAISASAVGINRSAAGSQSNNAISATDPCRHVGVTAACAGTDILADPQFLGGPNPTTVEGFIPLAPELFRAGTPVGPLSDFGGCAFAVPPSIGAWEMACGSRRVDRGPR